MNDHMDEALELYALGALERDEALAVEAHAAACARCSQLLGEAERTVTALDAIVVPAFEAPPELAARMSASARAATALGPRRPAPNLARSGALAACLAFFGLGTLAVRDIASQRATIAADDRAFAAIAGSHFAHTTLTKLVPDAPTAKVLWGKAPRWLYVIVDNASCGCDVVVRTASGERDLGAPQTRGSTATLFAAAEPDVTEVELRSGSRILATAKRP
jgi:hypothetical protein